MAYLLGYTTLLYTCMHSTCVIIYSLTFVAHSRFLVAAAAAKLKLLLSFAVGALLGDVFLHLLPEAWLHLKGNCDVSVSCEDLRLSSTNPLFCLRVK